MVDFFDVRSLAWFKMYSVFELHHHDLRFVLHIFFYEFFEDVERLTHVDQKNLILTFSNLRFELVLKDFSDDSDW